MMYESVLRCPCCNRGERTGVRAIGPDCDCDRNMKCEACRKCTSHCTCMTVGRVMLRAIRGRDVVPESCEGRECHQCVACAVARLQKRIASFQQFVDDAQERLKAVLAMPLSDVPKSLAKTADWMDEATKIELKEDLDFELALREPEPSCNWD